MIHDLRFMDHALTYWFAAISESQSEFTLLDIALSWRPANHEGPSPPGGYRERLIRGIGWAASNPFCTTVIGGQSAGNRHIECWSASGRESDLPEEPSNDRV